MATNFLGYRYINTSIGYAKVLYFETTTPQSSLSQSEFSSAFGRQTYDGSITQSRSLNNARRNLNIAGATICGKVAVVTGNGDLKAGNCVIGATGGEAGTNDDLFTSFIILKLANGNYQLCAFSSGGFYRTMGGYTYPSSENFGYFVSKNVLSINVVYYSSSYFDADISNYLKNNPPLDEIPTDPYTGAGDSGTGGGDGTFDGTNEPVNFPPLPTVGAADAGFITLFAPTAAQLKALAAYMWSSLFDIEGGGTGLAFKKLFNDPMDCILGMSVVPVSVPTSGAREITIGNLVTTVSMNVASQQYIEVDCGSIDFSKRYFGSYLDFEPYTKMSIFLPYCGVHQISADDVMGKNVHVKYHIDILTGSCIAFIKCGESIVYEFNGACASNIPVNSINYASTIENAIRIAVNIGTTVATAGAAAPMSAGEDIVANAQNIGRSVSLAGSTAEGALSMKPSISRSGALGGGVGLLGHQIPYIIITRPKLCKPKNQDFFQGYPSFIQMTVGDLTGTGFTSFETVIIAEQYLTEGECAELESILRGGIYL